MKEKKLGIKNEEKNHEGDQNEVEKMMRIKYGRTDMQACRITITGPSKTQSHSI
jgi:hypothetical protein